MARSIYCSSCRKEKEPGRDNESCCKSCKNEAYNRRTALRRQQNGLPPIGSGRSIYCYECKKIKENGRVISQVNKNKLKIDWLSRDCKQKVVWSAEKCF